MIYTIKISHQKTEKHARTSRSCCPALHLSLPLHPVPPASPPCVVSSHPSFSFSKKRWPWLFDLERFYFHLWGLPSIFLLGLPQFQSPQLGDKLLWGQESHLKHLWAATVSWLRIGTHKMHIDMNWWNLLTPEAGCRKSILSPTEQKISKLVY